MSGANTLTFSDASWDKDVLNSETPVLVDFWAEWQERMRRGMTEDFSWKASAARYASLYDRLAGVRVTPRT